MTILLNNGRVANINIFENAEHEKNVKSTTLCGRLISVDDRLNYVREVCGKPVMEKPLQTRDMETNELSYEGRAPNVLLFENDKLQGWK